MVIAAKEVTWVIQAARDTGTVQYKYRIQLTRSRLSGDENLCPQTVKCHLLHSLVFPFTSTGQAVLPSIVDDVVIIILITACPHQKYNSQKYRVY